MLTKIVDFRAPKIHEFLRAKKILYQEIVNNLSKNPGINGDDITIVLYEPPLGNWGIKGRNPANEVDLGFNINV